MTQWTMPRPKIGDAVLYSNDPANFSDPVMGWVIRQPGDSAVHLLVFAPETGFIEKNSVHHRDDPDLKENPGWWEYGAWAFTDAQEAINSAVSLKSQLAIAMSKLEGTARNGRNEAPAK